jgi:thiol-disulfide isomerase/thioredoxin
MTALEQPGLTAERAASPLAPDFEIPPFGEGATLRLSEFRGNGVVLNFWASWCFPCRQEMALLESTWQEYKDRGVVFIGINVWDQQPDAVEFLRESGVTYLNGPDIDGDVVEKFTVAGIPTTLFIAPDGRLNHTIYGLLNSDSLSQAVATIAPD